MFLQQSRLGNIDFRDLRYSSATLLGQGVRPKIAQERLERSTLEITLDTYSLVLPDMRGEAADRLDAFSGAPRA